MNAIVRALPASMCHRLRGLSILAGDGCACFTERGFLECPPEARRPIPLAKSAPATALTGDFCHECGSANVRRAGTCLLCGDCGSTSGGCS